MNDGSRVKKTLLNVRVSMVCYVITIVLSFFTRKVFLDRLGDEFIGLTTTVNSLLAFINLAELGVAASIAYFLYKPLLDDDRKRINELMSIMGYLYRLIGAFVLLAGIIFSFFLPSIFHDTGFRMYVVFYCFYAQLASSLIGYFFNYRPDTLFSADQRMYMIQGYSQAVKVIMLLTQAYFALHGGSFVAFITVELLFTAVNSVVLNWRFEKYYSWVEATPKDGLALLKQNPQIMPYVGKVFMHKTGGFVNKNLMPTIIYAIASLNVVTLYANYQLLTKTLESLVNAAMGGSAASVGNLVAEGDKKKIYGCYEELYSAKFVFCGIVSVCLMRLCSPLVAVWLGPEYVLSAVVVGIIALDFFQNLIRTTTDQFIDAYGLKSDIWVPMIRIASLVFVFAAGKAWGLAGILAVTTGVSLLLMHTWKPYYLYSKGFHENFLKYFRLVVINLIPMAVSLFATIVLTNRWYSWDSLPESVWRFFVMTLVFGMIFSISYSLLALAMIPHVRSFVKHVMSNILPAK